jgi:hypothetical protein
MAGEDPKDMLKLNSPLQEKHGLSSLESMDRQFATQVQSKRKKINVRTDNSIIRKLGPQTKTLITPRFAQQIEV